MNFGKCIHLGNPNPCQEIECYYHLRVPLTTPFKGLCLCSHPLPICPATLICVLNPASEHFAAALLTRWALNHRCPWLMTFNLCG